MDKQRALILMSNLLCEIVDKVWEGPSEQYESWLIEEVGFTKEEINELKEKELFHEPLDYVRE